VELSFSELIAGWWDGTLQRDQVVFGIRWYWWALAGKTFTGVCLLLAALDLLGKDRLAIIGDWLSWQTEASTLGRIVKHWQNGRSVKLYYDTNFARLPTEDALKRMDTDAQYIALTERMENNFDQIEWKRLIPWAVSLVLVFATAHYLDSSTLLITGFIVITLPTLWSYIVILLLRPLQIIASTLKQHALFRAIYWIGAATWLLELADLGRGLST